MSKFAIALANRLEGYIDLQHSLGYQFSKQSSSLRAFLRYIQSVDSSGPLSQVLAVDFVMTRNLTRDGRAICFGVIRRFAEYYAAFDPDTKPFDRLAFPRPRVVLPPRILSEEELNSLMAAAARISTSRSLRGRTLGTVIGLLASTGLRSGEALRLNCIDVDLGTGVLQILKTKFRKDRLVPIHATTLDALQSYATARDLAFPAPTSSAFFLSSRGTRLSSSGLYYGFEQACDLAAVNVEGRRALRPHDLRHRFAVTRLAQWNRESADVQSMLPLLATYMGHARYSDTAYYITGTPELLGLAAAKAFGEGGIA